MTGEVVRRVVPTEREGGDKEFVQSLGRGIAVITAFSRSQPAMTLSQVALVTGLTRATARRFLHTLLDLGFVRSDGRLFRLTPKVLDLGYSFLSSFQIGEIAEPYLQELVQTYGESASIAVIDTDEVVFVGKVQSNELMSLSLSVGTRLPAYCTALGRVLLSDYPVERLQAYLNDVDLAAHTTMTETDPGRLRESVLQAGQQGYALVSEELEQSLSCIAVPIRTRTGRTIAAINMSVVHQRVDDERLRRQMLPALTHAADQIMHASAA